MGENTARSLRCTQSDLYKKVVELDPDLRSGIQHIENLRNVQQPDRATVTGALLLLNDIYRNIIQLFEDTIVQLKELWPGKKMKNLYSYLWIAKNFQLATFKWKAAINKEQNLQGYRERLLRRAEFLAYIATKFQERVLKNLKTDNDAMQSETLDTNRLRESLRKGQRFIALDLLKDYKGYASVALRSINTLFQDCLIYRGGYQSLWGYYAACEMCLVIRAELTNYAAYYNGKGLSRAVAQIDPKNLSRWFLSVPEFETALNHLKTLNPEFQDLKKNYDFKILNLQNGQELKTEFRKLALWSKSLLLRHRLDLIAAFVETKNSQPTNTVQFNAGYNLYETALEFFWKAKSVIDRRSAADELSLDRYMSLIDHIHVFGFSLAIAIHLIRKLTAFGDRGSSDSLTMPTRLNTSAGSMNVDNLVKWSNKREPAVILSSSADPRKQSVKTIPLPALRQPGTSTFGGIAKYPVKPSRLTVPKQPSTMRPSMPAKSVHKQQLKTKTKLQSIKRGPKQPSTAKPAKRKKLNSAATAAKNANSSSSVTWSHKTEPAVILSSSAHKAKIVPTTPATAPKRRVKPSQLTVPKQLSTKNPPKPVKVIHKESQATKTRPQPTKKKPKQPSTVEPEKRKKLKSTASVKNAKLLSSSVLARDVDKNKKIVTKYRAAKQ